LNSDTAAIPLATATDDITYLLTLTGIGDCAVSDTVFLRVLKGPEIPNAFSPNGDGINDVWRIKYLEFYSEATVQIFNRYGQLVYLTTGYGVPWDGNFKGTPLPIGTYYYIINPKNGREIMKGSVTIVR
jgi:gliding motility-associated-like protein